MAGGKATQKAVSKTIKAGIELQKQVIKIKLEELLQEQSNKLLELNRGSSLSKQQFRRFKKKYLVE